ncbi:unnamed protein product, partial [Adineta steineri]
NINLFFHANYHTYTKLSHIVQFKSTITKSTKIIATPSSSSSSPITTPPPPPIVKHSSMIVQCISETKSELPVLPHLPDVTPEATRTASPSKSHIKYYTSGHIVDNKTFTKHVDFILSTVLPSPNQTDVESERRANLAAYFLDWHLNNAFNLAVTDFKRKFRK